MFIVLLPGVSSGCLRLSCKAWLQKRKIDPAPHLLRIVKDLLKGHSTKMKLIARSMNTVLIATVAISILGGAAYAAPKTTQKPAQKIAKKPMAKKMMKKVALRSDDTNTTSSNILPVMSVTPSFYVIGTPMAPDLVEPNAAPESRAGYSILPATPTLNTSTPEAGSTVPGTLQAAIGIEPEYSVLNRLIVYSGLASEIRKVGPYTLLAPTNSAFAKLPEGTLDDLIRPENIEKLRSIIKAHLIMGDVKSAQVSGMTSATTLQGNSFPITTTDGAVMIGGAKVVKADVSCANGVIHTIDTVLMP